MVTHKLWAGWLGHNLPSNSIVPARSLDNDAPEHLVGMTNWYGQVESQHSGHSPAYCVNDGVPCPAHKPTLHHMRFWPVEFSYPGDWFVRKCPHDVWHPDPDSFPYWNSRDSRAHGNCDGCCLAQRRALRYIRPRRRLAPDVAP